jgi:hypothetical protein
MRDALGEPAQSVLTGRPVLGRGYRLHRKMLRNELLTCYLGTEHVSLLNGLMTRCRCEDSGSSLQKRKRSSGSIPTLHRPR